MGWILATITVWVKAKNEPPEHARFTFLPSPLLRVLLVVRAYTRCASHHLQHCTCIHSFNRHSSPGVQPLTRPVPQMEKMEMAELGSMTPSWLYCPPSVQWSIYANITGCGSACELAWWRPANPRSHGNGELKVCDRVPLGRSLTQAIAS